jgi:para-nitrobenzyl esterase
MPTWSVWFQRRLSRLLRIDSAASARIADAYRTAMPAATEARLWRPSPPTTPIAATSRARRNCNRPKAEAPAYTYVFDWRTPVRGGVLQSPHTLEVPFVFGTVAGNPDGERHEALAALPPFR